TQFKRREDKKRKEVIDVNSDGDGDGDIDTVEKECGTDVDVEADIGEDVQEVVEKTAVDAETVGSSKSVVYSESPSLPPQPTNLGDGSVANHEPTLFGQFLNALQSAVVNFGMINATTLPGLASVTPQIPTTASKPSKPSIKDEPIGLWSHSTLDLLTRHAKEISSKDKGKWEKVKGYAQLQQFKSLQPKKNFALINIDNPYGFGRKTARRTQ
ncbi:hypothetical protein HDU76_009280, partial [Blyttiomyces sp. JEL0837]